MFHVARRILLALAILVGLLLAVIAALPRLLSFDSVRARLVAAAELALHRKVEARSIRLQIFPALGAGAEGVVVRNGPGWETPKLLEAERVSVKLAFWPLLSRRIEVRRVVLDGATLTIERDPRGTLNLDDLAPATGSGGRGESDPAAEAAPIRVAEVEVTRGRLRLVDRHVALGETATTTFDAVEGRVAGISRFTPTSVELSGRLLADGDRNVLLKGTFGPLVPGRPIAEMPIDASLSARGLALGRLGRYLGSRPEDPGVLTLDTNVSGPLAGSLKIAGSVKLVPRRGSRSRVPEIDGRFRGVLDRPHWTLTLERSAVSIAKLPLVVEGRIQGLRGKPRLDLALATREEVPIDRVTALPAVASALPPGLRLSGRVRLAASLRGPADGLAVHGSASAAPLGLSRDGDDGPLLAAPSATATLESKGDGPRAGRLSISSGELRRLHFQNLRADWSWDAAKGSLVVAPSADVYGGRIAARLESEIGKPEPVSRATLELDGVHGDALVEAATTTHSAFAGILTGRLSLVSRGLSWDAIRSTASGQGHIAVTGPNLYTVHIKPEVGRALAAIAKYTAGLLAPPSLQSTTFEKLDTSLRLAEGALATPDLTLSGRDATVEAAGSLGLDKTLAYRGRVVLQPSLVESFGTAGRYIADARGRVVLPFQVSGTIMDPKVTVDTSVLMDLGRRLAARLAGDRLGGWWKVLGEAIGSGTLPMPGGPMPGGGSGGFPMPGGGGFPMPGMGGLPSPGDILQRFLGDRSKTPERESQRDSSPPATPF
ncbi:MAG TPA: AsmA family protein [Thermoanaerobaculia bacterium]